MPERITKPSDYEKWLAAYPASEEFAYRFLVQLRRTIAGDGPHDRPPGALEAFDAACDKLGVPFLKP
jgi:hypothetical protein